MITPESINLANPLHASDANLTVWSPNPYCGFVYHPALSDIFLAADWKKKAVEMRLHEPQGLLSKKRFTEDCFRIKRSSPMAAWTLPQKIADLVHISHDHLGCWKPQVLRYRDSRDASGHRTPDGFELALRAAAVGDDWQNHYHHFLQTVGRSAGGIAKSLLHLAVEADSGSVIVGEFVKMVIDDSPTKPLRTEGGTGEGLHHNPNAGTRRVRNFCMDMSGSRSVLAGGAPRAWGCIAAPLLRASLVAMPAGKTCRCCRISAGLALVVPEPSWLSGSRTSWSGVSNCSRTGTASG